MSLQSWLYFPGGDTYAILYSVLSGDVREFWVRTDSTDSKVCEIPEYEVQGYSTSYDAYISSAGQNIFVMVRFNEPEGQLTTTNLFVNVSCTLLLVSMEPLFAVTYSASASVELTPNLIGIDPVFSYSGSTSASIAGTTDPQESEPGSPLGNFSDQQESTVVVTHNCPFTSTGTGTVIGGSRPEGAFVDGEGSATLNAEASPVSIGINWNNEDDLTGSDSDSETYYPNYAEGENQYYYGQFPTVAYSSSEPTVLPGDWRLTWDTGDPSGSACVDEWQDYPDVLLYNNNHYLLDLEQVISGQTLATLLETSTTAVNATVEVSPFTENGSCSLGATTEQILAISGPGRGNVESITLLY